LRQSLIDGDEEMTTATFGRKGVSPGMNRSGLSGRGDPSSLADSARAARPLPSMKSLLGEVGEQNAQSYSSSTTATNVSEIDMMRAIGSNWTKYRDLWQTMGSDKIAFGFSFSAFFLSGFWLLYRKMYGVFFATFALSVVANFAMPDGGAISSMVNFLIAAGLGAFGKSLVVARNRDMILRIDRLRLPPYDRDRRIEKAGGTSILAPLLFLGLVIVMGAVIGVAAAAKVHQLG
jgi:hypothetical protein